MNKYSKIFDFEEEIRQIKMRYEKRKTISDERYSILAPQTYLMLQELEKKIIKQCIKNSNLINKRPRPENLYLGSGGLFSLSNSVSVTNPFACKPSLRL